MNQNRTASILQRFAVVLAVTAASYGLPQEQVKPRTTGQGQSSSHAQTAAQRS